MIASADAIIGLNAKSAHTTAVSFAQAAFYLLNRLVNHYKDHVESFRKVTAEAKAEARRDFGVENDGEIQRLVKKQVQSQREKNGQFEANRLAAIQRA